MLGYRFWDHSTSFTPSSNMRLLNEIDNRDVPCKTRMCVNSVRTSYCARENYVKDVVEMNEKKCFENICLPSAGKFSSSAKVRSLSPMKEDNSDSGEELQYGPGIVNKLKTKYMSMTLRDNVKKRPPLSNLRKANSLDNLLDEEIMDGKKTYQISSVISCVNKLDYSDKESSSCVTVNFCADLKRARSMEALQDEKSPSNIKSVVIRKTKITNHANSTTDHNSDISIPLDSIVNEDVIIVENLISQMKTKERKQRSSLESTELPPPDVVKETLKIFENGQRKPVVKNWRQVKSESLKKPNLKPKPQLYPKPVLDNKVTIKTSEEKLPLRNGHIDHTLLSSIKVNFESNKESRHHTTLSHTTCIRNEKNSINVNVKTSAVVAGGSTFNTSFASCSTKTMSPQQQYFRDSSNIIDNKSRNVMEADCKYRGILKPVDALPTRQIGIIRPLVNSVKQLPSQDNFSNKSPCSEKPDHVRDKTDFFSSVPLESCLLSHKNVNTCKTISKPSTLWIREPWNQQQNSMIFNFKDRKEVPDYIENDGLSSCMNRDRTKRIFEENGGTPGYIVLGAEHMAENTSGNESTTDSPNSSYQDEQTMPRSSSPYNIHFKGDNVVINGKSSLRKFPKEKNLRIQFNDTCTIFEYPSEESLLEDDTDSKNDDESSNAPSSVESSHESLIVPSASSKMYNPLSGGSGLASYVPSKLGVGMNDSFELGVTKSSNPITLHPCSKDGSTNTTNRVNDAGGDNRKVDIADLPSLESANINENVNNDHVKPAAESENIAWSEESIPDLLF